MKTFSLSEARRKLSKLVSLASGGEQLGITRRGKLVAVIEPPPPKQTLKEIFDSIEEIRRHAKPLPKGVTVKDLIEEGRR
jgi:prevent-host-death family protein